MTGFIFLKMAAIKGSPFFRRLDDARNIDYRIEVATPLLDPRLKQRVLDIIDILFSDTVKARYIDKELSNRYVRGNRRKVRAQLAIYDYIKSLPEQPE